MSAAEALHLARKIGVRVTVAGNDLILSAEKEPAPTMVETIRSHKPEIIALLQESEGDWAKNDWRLFFNERAALAELDGRQSRIDAEAIAFECCVVEWLNCHQGSSDFGHCAMCGRDGHDVAGA